MMLTSCRREVENRALKAERSAANVRLTKVRLHNWTRENLGTLHASAWFFAAGTLWAGTRTRNDGVDGENRSKKALRIANTALIVSRLVAAALPAEGVAADAANIDTVAVA